MPARSNSYSIFLRSPHIKTLSIPTRTWQNTLTYLEAQQREKIEVNVFCNISVRMKTYFRGSLFHQFCSADSISFINLLLGSQKQREIFCLASHSFKLKLQERCSWALWNQLIYTCLLFNQNILMNVDTYLYH